MNEILKPRIYPRLFNVGVLVWRGALLFFPFALFAYVGIIVFAWWLGESVSGLEGHFLWGSGEFLCDLAGRSLWAVMLICAEISFIVPFVLAPYTQKEKFALLLILFNYYWLWLTGFSPKKRKECFNAWREAPTRVTFGWMDGLCMFFSALAIGVIAWFTPPDLFIDDLNDFAYPMTWLTVGFVQFPFLCFIGFRSGETLQAACEQRIYPFVLLHGVFNSLLTQCVMLGFGLTAVHSVPEFLGLVVLVLLYGIYFVLGSATSLALFMTLAGIVKLASMIVRRFSGH